MVSLERGEKECFGVLEKVFPMGEDGLREIDVKCFDCPLKKECLQKALSTREGLEFRASLLERMPVVSIGDRIKRWSQRKELSRRMKEADK
jgi:hypothetical protein